MLDFEQELAKFTPCLEIDEVEDAIYDKDLSDVGDIMKQMLNDLTSDDR